MMADLHITQGQIAFLSSAVYIGVSIASLVVSPIMAIVSTKHVLVVTFFANAWSSLLFAYSSSYSWLTFARFMLGFTQAFCFVYAPVWINEFSPKAQSTRWMATNQAFCMIGVIFGYAVGAVIVDLPPEYNTLDLDWRKGFALQGFCLLFIALGFMSFNNERLDIFGDRTLSVPMNVDIMSHHSR